MTIYRDLPEWVREPLHPITGLFHDLAHGQPRTLAQQHAHIKNRAWVHPDLTGRPARINLAAGWIFHQVIAPPVKAAGKTIDGAADYPLRLIGLIVFVIAFIILIRVI